MDERIKFWYDKGVENPSGIVSLLFKEGFEGRYTELRKYVITELSRIRSAEGQSPSIVSQKQ